MTILDAIKRYRELSIKNRRNRGLLPTENDEIFKLQKFIEEHIIEAINEGYVLVFNSDEDEEVTNKPSKEQWKDYLVVQYSGITNMYNMNVVCSYSKNNLTNDIIFYIMEHYAELENEFRYTINDITEDDLEQYGLA